MSSLSLVSQEGRTAAKVAKRGRVTPGPTALTAATARQVNQDQNLFGISIGGIIKTGIGLLPGGKTAIDIAEKLLPKRRMDAPPDPRFPISLAPGCRAGFKENEFGECVKIQQRLPAFLPGGETGLGGRAVAGAFGMPAIEPVIFLREHRECPKAMVLGEDDLCYPRAVLRRDSRFRKWKPGARPILTGGQRRAISKARTAVTTARDAIAGLGVTVKKK